MARISMSDVAMADFAIAALPAEALFELGLRYCTGREVGQDLVQAHKWFNIAAMQGNTEARRHRAEISREMSPDQIAYAQREARAWLTTH